MTFRLQTWWLTEPGRSIGIGSLLALALHLPFLGAALQPDEGGYLLVARQWHADGPSLYGHLWVDRPPLLLVAFWAIDTLLGIDGLRVLASLAAVALVAAAGWAGWVMRAAAGARWGSLTAAAMGSSYAVGAHRVDAELLAAPFMMAGCAYILQAMHQAGTRRRALWTVGAGVAATSAMLIKQSFVDALVFCGVLVIASVWRRDLARAAGLRMLGWLVLGALLPVGGTVLWAHEHGAGVGELWYMLYGFRAAALDVIVDYDLTAPFTRLLTITVLAVISGIVMLAWRFVRSSRKELRRGDPFTLALLAMLVTGVSGILLGGSYWSHYLIQIGPALALATAAVGGRADRHGHRMRRWVLASVASAVIATVTGVAANADDGGLHEPAVTTGHWLAASADRRDTAVVTYGAANVLATSGLSTPYPYLWSLPVRTLDPRLNRLISVLKGPRAPTWVIQWDDLDAWQLDRAGRLARTLRTHYRQVTTVCGHPIYLRAGVSRDLARPPVDCES